MRRVVCIQVVRRERAAEREGWSNGGQCRALVVVKEDLVDSRFVRPLC